MTPIRILTGAFAVLMIALAVWRLEASRAGLSITELSVGETPVTVYRQPGATGPAVVIAHGFAGSRQFMEAFALSLARAGYLAVSFDFQGHGRNPRPMSGDVTRIDGTTALLLDELGGVIDAVLAMEGVAGPVALVGHSMASDIVVRRAVMDERVAAIVAVSMYSEAVAADRPDRLLVVSGEWERHLRAGGLAALRLVDPEAGEGETAVDPDSGLLRRAVVAPRVEHVGVLYSRVSLEEARAWIDEGLGRNSAAPVAGTGLWILVLLGGIVLLAWPLAALLPAGEGAAPDRPPRNVFFTATLIPALVAPLLLSFAEIRLLPVLVADYLALHLLLYGAIALAILWRRGIRLGGFAMVPALALLAFGVAVFGGALDRYAASFMPHAERLPIILVLALGAVPFTLADSLLTEGGRAPVWRRLFSKVAFLASLGFAVALDPERLYFLAMVFPVVLLFFLVYGLMGSWVGRRGGKPMVPGLALGLILAWALGVSFPMIAA